MRPSASTAKPSGASSGRLSHRSGSRRARRRRRSRSRRSCPSAGLPQPQPAMLCWLTRRWRRSALEHDPGSPELEPVELRVVQPHRRLAAAGRHPPDRRVDVVGDVELAAAAPGGVVGRRRSEGKVAQVRCLPLRGFRVSTRAGALSSRIRRPRESLVADLDAVIGARGPGRRSSTSAAGRRRASTRARARHRCRRSGSCRCPRRRGGWARRRRGPGSRGSGSARRPRCRSARASAPPKSGRRP